MGLLLVIGPIHLSWPLQYFFFHWQNYKSYQFPFSITSLKVRFSTGRKFGASTEVLPCYFRLNPGTEPER